MKRIGLISAVAVAALLLVGCTQTADDAKPPAISHLVVSPDGIRDLRVGMPVTSYALVNYGEHACPATGGWLPRYPQDEENSGGQELDPFDVVTRSGSRSGQIVAEYVWSRKIETAKGIHVGSSLAAVRSAYPHAAIKKSDATAMYVVAGSGGQLVIEVSAHNSYAAGEWPQNWLDTVVWMDVIPRSAEVESIAGSNDAGPCPVKGHVPDMDVD
jgi:hypothetical protein